LDQRRRRHWRRRAASRAARGRAAAGCGRAARAASRAAGLYTAVLPVVPRVAVLPAGCWLFRRVAGVAAGLPVLPPGLPVLPAGLLVVPPGLPLGCQCCRRGCRYCRLGCWLCRRGCRCCRWVAVIMPPGLPVLPAGFAGWVARRPALRLSRRPALGEPPVLVEPPLPPLPARAGQGGHDKAQ